MKNIIYILLILCTIVACSSPSSSGSTNDDGDQIINTPNDEFIKEITISDSLHSQTLTFGMQKEFTEGFDPEGDVESPPFFPPGAFSAYFSISGYNLYKDIKSNKPDSVNWHVEITPAGNQPIGLSWDAISNNLSGTFILQDKLNNPKFSINMATDSGFILEPKDDQFFILYRPEKNNTNMAPTKGAITTNQESTDSFSKTNINSSANINLSKKSNTDTIQNQK